MKLDERIKNKLMIYDCYETIEAEKYVGKNGYFTNNFPDFADLSKTTYGTLTEIATNNYSEKPYYNDDKIYAYFLPEEYVKQEKTFRPLTIQEFQNEFNIGNVIRFRRKDNKVELYQMLLGYTFDVSIRIIIGCGIYTLQGLFKEFEFKKEYDDAWRQFGVEE